MIDQRPSFPLLERANYQITDHPCQKLSCHKKKLICASRIFKHPKYIKIEMTCVPIEDRQFIHQTKQTYLGYVCYEEKYFRFSHIWLLKHFRKYFSNTLFFSNLGKMIFLQKLKKSFLKTSF